VLGALWWRMAGRWSPEPGRKWACGPPRANENRKNAQKGSWSKIAWSAGIGHEIRQIKSPGRTTRAAGKNKKSGTTGDLQVGPRGYGLGGGEVAQG